LFNLASGFEDKNLARAAHKYEVEQSTGPASVIEPASQTSAPSCDVILVEDGVELVATPSPARALQQSLHDAMSVRESASDDRWPAGVRLTLIVGMSVAMWAGIGAAVWNVLHH